MYGHLPLVAKRLTQDSRGRKPPATSRTSYAPVDESHSSSERKPHGFPKIGRRPLRR
jgi:hypothetical protein